MLENDKKGLIDNRILDSITQTRNLESRNLQNPGPNMNGSSGSSNMSGSSNSSNMNGSSGSSNNMGNPPPVNSASLSQNTASNIY